MSRELDAWVVEHIFGYYPFWEGSELVYCKEPLGKRQTIYDVPYYSTNLMDAWEIMEKFLETVDFDIRFGLTSPYVTAIIKDEKGKTVQSADTKAPKAICLSAYKYTTGKDWEEKDSVD